MNDIVQFYTLEIIQYIVQKIPRTEEQPLVYKMFATNMEPWETITNRVTRLPSIQARSPMRVEPSEVDL